MTVAEFLKASEDYFGRWQRITVRTAVQEFLSKRPPRYLDILWPLLRDSRSLNYGAPDMRSITDLHIEVCDRLEVTASSARQAVPSQRQIEYAEQHAFQRPITQADIDSWSKVEDGPGDRWLSRSETREALAIVYGRLQAKDEERKAEEKAARRRT